MMNALALVDESLDWSYQQGADWGEGAWYESGTASSRRVTLSRTGTKWEVMAHWVFPTGRERRLSRFNQSGLSEAAAKRLVHEALTETWSSRSS